MFRKGEGRDYKWGGGLRERERERREKGPDLSEVAFNEAPVDKCVSQVRLLLS